MQKLFLFIVIQILSFNWFTINLGKVFFQFSESHLPIANLRELEGSLVWN